MVEHKIWCIRLPSLHCKMSYVTGVTLNSDWTGETYGHYRVSQVEVSHGRIVNTSPPFRNSRLTMYWAETTVRNQYLCPVMTYTAYTGHENQQRTVVPEPENPLWSTAETSRVIFSKKITSQGGDVRTVNSMRICFNTPFHLGVLKYLTPSEFPNKIVKAFLISYMLPSCPMIFLDLNTLIIFGENKKLWILHYVLFSNFFLPLISFVKIYSSTYCSGTSWVNVLPAERKANFHTNKITGYIVLYFTFTISDMKRKDGKCKTEQ